MPAIEELRFDQRARAEGYQKALALPEAHLVRLVNAQRDECERSTTRLRQQWAESWRYYQDGADYSDKEDWQSTIWIPTPWTAVEQACNVLKLGLLNSPDFFKIDGVDKRDKLLADAVWNPVLRFAFQKAAFAEKFIDAIKVSLACGISQYLKFRYPSLPSPILDSLQLVADQQGPRVVPQYRMRRQAALTVETVAPWKIYRDPASRPGEQWSGGYLLHEDYVDRAVINNPRLYRNLETVLTAGSSGGDSRDGAAQHAQRQGLAWEPHEFRRPVLAGEWYGDLLDENGDMVYPDAMLIVADRKAVIYGPVDTPLWAVCPKTFRRKWPFVGFAPLRHPLRFEGFGILQAVTPLAVLFSNLFNLFADGLNWKVNQPTELNTALLDEEDDKEHYPGKLWRKIGDGQLLTPAQIGQMGTAEVLAAMQFMHTLWEQNAFVNNFVQGTEGTRRQITKGEVQIRTQQSLGMFDGMGRDIEAGGMACLELAYDFLSQYMTDWTDPTIAAVVGPQYAQLLTMMDPAARMRELGGQYNYLFTGITANLQKADLLGRLLQAAALAAEGPYAGLTNPVETLQTIFNALGVRDKITVYEQPMVPLGKMQEILASAVPAAAASMAAGQGRGPTMKQLAPTPNEMSTSVGA